MDWVDGPKNYKGLYGILQLLQCSHLDNFPQKTLKGERKAITQFLKSRSYEST